MKKFKFNNARYYFYIIVSFIMAALTFSGVFLSGDLKMRVVIGLIWSFLGISWVFRYRTFRKTK